MDSIKNKRRWVIAVKGVLLLSFAWFVITHPQVTIMTATYILGLVLFFSGLTILMDAFDSSVNRKSKNALIVEGLVDVLLGFSLFVVPIFFAEILVMILGAWMLIAGVLKIWHSYKDHNLTFTLNVINLKTAITLVVGFFLLISPIVGIVIISWIISIVSAFLGFTLLYYAYSKNEHSIK